MKAVVIHAARDLRIEQRDEQSPKSGQLTVSIKAGGICGSDLHYFHNGGFGAIRLKEPMILGHEVAGEISSIGDGVTDFSVGDRVAISPGKPCNHCLYCREGKQQHCLNMRFYGSAMPMPHIQGAFCQKLVVEEWQCHRINGDTSFAAAAFAEPLSVALHAFGQLGTVLGKKVLITGAGPIGSLCVIAARLAGASQIVITDIQDAVIDRAKLVGADQTVNVANNEKAYRQWSVNKGTFDVAIEASGSEMAMRSAIEVVRPQGTIVQLGLGDNASLPMNMIVAKELTLKGSFRFHEEFGHAVNLISNNLVNTDVLHTGTFDLEDAVAAFQAAGDRTRHTKVQISF
jgi:L-idonate 5-dehydrogenase